MKGGLETRPVFVRSHEHIEAHLLICMLALVVIRLIQIKIVDSCGKRNTESCWEYGLSDERIISALKKWTVDNMDGNLFRMNNVYDPDLQTILNAYRIRIPEKFFTRQELKALKNSFQIF